MAAGGTDRRGWTPDFPHRHQDARCRLMITPTQSCSVGRPCVYEDAAMGWLMEMLQGIPLNAVLRERVTLAEQKYKDLESENKKLKEQVETLASELASLRGQVEAAPVASVLAQKPKLK